MTTGIKDAHDGANEATSGRIADLSYRDYDGPLQTRAIRWWIVALAGIRLAMKKRGFWILCVIAALPYLVIGFILYAQAFAPSGIRNQLVGSTEGHRFAAQFFSALSSQSFWLFILALMVGASSIAADNQANALLVYLSKPLTKGDYLLGKWMGIFLTLFGIAYVPALILFIFCLLSYSTDSFLKTEPTLFFRMTAACAIPPTIHASLIVGCSAWSRSSRMAGAAYAGFYFISSFVSGAFWGIRYHGNLSQGILERHLSIDGVIKGLAQNFYGVTVQINRIRAMAQATFPPPPVWTMLAVAICLILVGVIAARVRIRAVEVIRG